VSQTDITKHQVNIPLLSLQIKRSPFVRNGTEQAPTYWEVSVPQISQTVTGVGYSVELAIDMLVDRLMEPLFRAEHPLFKVTVEWKELLKAVIPIEYRFSSILALKDKDPSFTSQQLLRTWVACGAIDAFTCSNYSGEPYVVTARLNLFLDIVEFTAASQFDSQVHVFSAFSELEEWLFIPEDERPLHEV
jgi:hypothetical protein